MLSDRYGLIVSTTSMAARNAYVEGVDLLLSANFGPVDAFQRSIDIDPGFVLAHVAKARALQLLGDMPAAHAAIAAANDPDGPLSEREAGQVAFLNLVLSGMGRAALEAASSHLETYPRDAMVLAPCTTTLGLFGFSGRAGRERALADFLEHIAPHYGDDWWFNWMRAFALAEVSDVARARPMIERSMEHHPSNAHGAHVMAHIYYETGEPDVALSFLRD